MAFKKFVKTGNRSYLPKIGIWSRGQIGFNQSFVEVSGLDKFEYVVLYYDDEAKRIGIEFTNDVKAEGACKVIKRKTGGFSVTAVAFFKSFGINYSKSMKYDPVKDKEANMWVVQLVAQNE